MSGSVLIRLRPCMAMDTVLRFERGMWPRSGDYRKQQMYSSPLPRLCYGSRLVYHAKKRALSSLVESPRVFLIRFLYCQALPFLRRINRDSYQGPLSHSWFEDTTCLHYRGALMRTTYGVQVSRSLGVTQVNPSEETGLRARLRLDLRLVYSTQVREQLHTSANSWHTLSGTAAIIGTNFPRGRKNSRILRRAGFNAKNNRAVGDTVGAVMFI